MPLYTILHNLLSVLARIANKMGLHKNEVSCHGEIEGEANPVTGNGGHNVVRCRVFHAF
jgi:hypothetical protein